MKATIFTHAGRSLVLLLLMVYPYFGFSQTVKETQEVSVIRVNDFLTDGDYLWMATSEGLVKLNKLTGVTTSFNEANAGLPENFLCALAKDKEGNIWVTTRRNGVGRFDGERCEVFNESTSGIPTEQWCTAITIDENDNKWIGSCLWLNKFDGTEWKSWTTPGSELAAAWFVHAITFDKDGTLWIGAETTTGFCFGKLTDKGIEEYAEVKSPVYSIIVDKDNTKWLASREGLIKFDGVNFTRLNDPVSSSPIDNVLDAKLDKQGNIWLASGNLLVKFDGTTFTRFESELITHPVKCVEPDEDGTIWVGTIGGGLLKFKDGAFEKIDLKNLTGEKGPDKSIGGGDDDTTDISSTETEDVKLYLTGSDLTLDINLSEDANVCINLFEVSGLEIRTITNSFFKPGKYNYTATIEKPGIYLVRLAINDNITIRKVAVK